MTVRANRVLACAAVCALALSAVPGRARSQDLAPEDRLVVTVHERMSLLHGGEPLADARLAFAVDGQGPADLVTEAVHTDARGKATLPPAATPRTLLVWGEGMAPAAFLVDGGGNRRVATEPERTLTVRVRDGRGVAAKDAQVTVRVALPLTGADDPELTPHTYSVGLRTDQDGVARFEGLADAPVTVVASLDGWLDATRFPVTPGPDPLTLELTRGSIVSGRVVLAPSGKPAQKGAVRLGDAVTELDREGVFRFERVAPGTRELRVTGPGLVPPPPMVLALREGKDRQDLVFEATQTASLSGTLHLSTLPGTPVESVASRPVTFRLTWPPGSGPPPDHVPPEPRDVTPRVDPAGGFLVQDLPPGDGVVLEARREGAVPVLIEGLSLRAGVHNEGLWIELDPGGSLTGRVADPEGRALKGAMVRAFEDDDTRTRLLHETASADDGTFRLDGLPGGTLRLEFAPPPAARAAALRMPGVAVERGAATDVGLVRLPAGLTLRGHVTGAPPSLRVGVLQGGRRFEPASIEAGDFVVEGLQPGTALLELAAGDAPPVSSRTVDVPSSGVLRLQFRPRVSVTVVVTDAAGDPVAEGTVRATPAGEDADASEPREPVETSFRSAAGRVAVELAAGDWNVTAAAPSLGAGTTLCSIAADAAAPTVDVRLSEGEIVRGYVIARDTGGPVEGASVSVVTGGPEDGALATTTDERGWYEVPGVQEGMVRVRVDATGYARREGAPVPVRRGGTPVLEPLELLRGTLLRGVVLSRRTPVREGTVVSLETDDGTWSQAALDLYGRFEIAGVPGGGATVHIDTGQGRPRARRIRVPWAEVYEVLLDLDAGTEVFGTVRTAGRPEPFARVVARASTRRGDALDVVEARADEYGRYRLPPVTPGRITLDVTLPGSDTGLTLEADVADSFDQLVDLNLPEGWVAGRVVAAQGGAPVAGAFVRLVDGGGSDRFVIGEAVSDERGLFRIERVPVGSHALEVERAGYGLLRLATVDVTGPAGVPGLDLALPDEAVLGAYVLDRERRRLPGAWLRAERRDEAGARTTVTRSAGPDGHVDLAGLTPGAWRITAGAPRRGTQDLGVLDLTPGRFEAGEIHLLPESAVIVSVLRYGLYPAAGVAVELTDVLGNDPRPPRRPDDALTGPDPRYVTGADGQLVLAGLAPGAYRVSLAGDEGSRVTVRVGESEIAHAYLFEVVPRPR